MRLLLSISIDIFYFTVLLVFLPFVLFRLLTRKKYWDTLKERFGFIKHLPKKKNCIWIHGVSVGEIKGARALICELKKCLPNKEIIISSTSSSGKKLASDLYSDHLVLYFPFDLTWIIRHYIKHFSPSLVILMELDLWPNFIWQMHSHNIPVILVNGRLSQKSFHGYQRVKYIFSLISKGIYRLAVQNNLYSQRFSQLGVDEQRMIVTGNMKFDAIDPERWKRQEKHLTNLFAVKDHHKILVMGSTHAQEEEILLSCYHKLQNRFAEMRLIIVPRHPKRAEEIACLVKKYGLIPIKKTAINKDFQFKADHVIIVDTMGELAEIYTIAYATIIGGGFVPHGGQNFIEPISLGKAVICGPHMTNFPEIRLFTEKKTILQLQSMDELYDAVAELLASPEKAKQLGKDAQSLIIQSQGSSQKNCRICLEVLREKE